MVRAAQCGRDLEQPRAEKLLFSVKWDSQRFPGGNLKLGLEGR